MRKSVKKRLFTGITALSLLIITGCTARYSVQNTETIQTIPAATGSIRKVITFVGNVTSSQSSELTWKTTGVIDSVTVGIGDVVTEGQILATLGNDSLSAAVINAEIPLITAQEDLDELLASETPKAQAYKELKDKESALQEAERYQESLKYPHAVSSDIAYWAEQVEIYREYYEEAQASLDDAVSWKHSADESERNLYETRRKAMLTALNKYAEVYNNYLYYSGTATDNQMAQAAANIGTAQAEYEKALKNFLTYVDYPREKDVASAQVQIESAENTYNRRNIVSDINGVVTSINAREGDYITANTSAFRLDNTSRLFIPMDISEIDIVQIYDGMRALIVLDANTAKTYEGIVTTVSASGETSGSRVTFETMVEILNPDEDVKIGMTAEVDLVVNESDNALIIPANAIFENNGTSYVTVISGESSRDIPVTVGIVTDTIAEITGGQLHTGDTVSVPSIDSSILKDMGMSNNNRGDFPQESGAFPAGMSPQGFGSFSAQNNEFNRSED